MNAHNQPLQAKRKRAKPLPKKRPQKSPLESLLQNAASPSDLDLGPLYDAGTVATREDIQLLRADIFTAMSGGKKFRF